MKKYNFIPNWHLVLLLSLIMVGNFLFAFEKSKHAYFQLKVYHYESDEQEKVIDKYLELAYLPALHKLGFKDVGVFKPLENVAGQDRLVYVFISVSDLNLLVNLDRRLADDQKYLEAGKAYMEASYSNPPFKRLETIWMKAFEGMPKSALPKLSAEKTKRIYELRSYEAATEQLSANKIAMFNNGEIDIFKKLNFNAVFYGQVIAGSTMPNLMYMTTFESMEDRNIHWKDFGPLYKPMQDLPQYQNNVSKNVTLLLHPTAYSDI
ncbi:NIPSNAP family protein [Sphingobacterium sp.]|uniref:NIPSNAP family protein n=1 Tax=Sphingobacterium sp. TaxID=341027 RepID=UPI00289CBBAB|nr:NIPSNAP family protein [Sphingobacterium sp.]